MFQLKPFNYQFCSLADRHGKPGDLCQKILQVDIKNEESYFDLMRFVLIVFSLNGLLYGLFDFVSNCAKKYPKTATLWHNDRFLLFPPVVTRCFRVTCSFIQLSSWIMLCYATFKRSTGLMMPWLIYHIAGLVLTLLKISLKASIGHVEWSEIRHKLLAFKVFIIGFVYFCRKYYETTDFEILNSQGVSLKSKTVQ
ncbi:uncharacterized protein LOC117793928 isoform X1 [Drosophila innubila]|uniref:uncharacterized protein LOC117793928 isoform X1 n=1 Tax=Drosophila innubila TaxID=198719 RepID=UPI00148C4228|nr:uncharacterized protein LOC117793928 isoform X1 [Drosophila innubila]